MEDLSRPDLAYVAKLRNLKITGLWTKDASIISKQILPITVDESQKLVKRREARSMCESKIYDLKVALAQLSIKCGSLTREGMIDVLIDNNHPIIPKQLEFDECQQDAIERSKTAQRMFIMASAGAGKTMTLCEIIVQAAKDPDARVIVLIFNVCAEATLIQRLKKRGVKFIHNEYLADPDQRGIAVLTFDKLGARINKSVEDPYDHDDPLGYGGDSTDGIPIGVNRTLETQFNRRDSYRKNLETAASNILRYGFGIWTHVIVDEGQDVVTSQAVFVDTLYNAHPDTKLIVAGDAKQQLYEGAVWFSNLWINATDDERVILKYNHRSDPEIVRVINAFGRKHFPLLHHDQIASREPNTTDSVQLKVFEGTFSDKATLAGIGKDCAQRLSECKPSDVYAIAPITTQKWALSFATDAMRQEITNISDCNVIVLSEGGKPTKKHYELGTSKKLKGTERSRVLVIGGDCDYSFCANKASQARALFVALSRARDELIIYVRRNQESEISDLSLLKPILDIIPNDIVIKKRRDPKLELRYWLKVCDDGHSAIDNGLASIEGLTLESTEMPIAPTIDIPISDFDADFVGCYAEALIAHSLGIKLASFDDVEVVYDDKYIHRGFFRNKLTGKYIISTSRDKVKTIKDNLGSLSEQGFSRTNDAYIHTVINYSQRASALWTVSSRLNQILDCEVGAYLKQCSESDDIIYQAYSEWSLGGKMHIIGAPDFIIGGVPIEIKHVKQLTDSHRRQAAIYATMNGSPYSVLLNSFDGQTEKVTAVPDLELLYLGRASIAIGNAKTFAKSKISPPITASVLVSIGATTALAFNSTDYKIIACLPMYSTTEELNAWINDKTGRRTYLCVKSDNLPEGEVIMVNELGIDIIGDDAIEIAESYILITKPIEPL